MNMKKMLLSKLRVVNLKLLIQLIFLVGVLATFEVNAFQSFVVQRIRILGLQRVSEAAVLNELPVCVGQSFSEAEASDVIHALYQTGFFKDVSLSKEGNTLVINVEERASISKLTITGVKRSR